MVSDIASSQKCQCGACQGQNKGLGLYDVHGDGIASINLAKAVNCKAFRDSVSSYSKLKLLVTSRRSVEQ